MSGELRKIFEEMSIEKLEEMIHDSMAAETPRFDDDAVLIMMEVLQEKRRGSSADTYDVSAMWNRFREDYLPGAESGSIYGDDEEEDAIVTDMPSTPKRRRSSFRIALRAASVALVFGILLTGIVSTTAYARGFDLWGIVARWTEEQFGFADGQVYAEGTLNGGGSPSASARDGEYESIRDALAANGIDAQLAPSWLPEGYELNRTTVSGSDSRLSIIAEYMDADKRVISITITRHGDSSGAFATHEKGAEDVEVYRAGEVDHYIMSNLDKTIITWINGSFECTIRGEFSGDTSRQIIDSIYERQ